MTSDPADETRGKQGEVLRFAPGARDSEVHERAEGDGEMLDRRRVKHRLERQRELLVAAEVSVRETAARPEAEYLRKLERVPHARSDDRAGRRVAALGVVVAESE